MPDFESSGGGGLDKGWQAQLLDADRWEIKDDVLTPIYPIAGGKPAKSPRSQPWPLDGGGAALEFEDIKEGRVFLPFKTYKSFGFGFNFNFAPLFAPNPNN